ncbi:MAG: tyrosine-type recombinase/integrase [Candidatus Sedimenticola sp. (ex Thyasira tokunagai)]
MSNTPYLSEDQIIDLLTAADEGKNKSTRLVIEICLSTGARWTEAESLKRSQIGSHKITFSATKNSKNRSLPIPDCLHRKLSAIKNDHLFTPCYSAFREAIERAGITLPKGQLSHVLRHTFASSFMMNKGDILVLQRALGHNNLTMTMRYAHFAPEHMSQVSTLNPLC